jgi:ATP-dependent Clp protease ATP-binding subunit ClpC
MHVLFTLLKNPKIGSVFLRLGISSKTVQKLIDQVLVHDDREREPLLGEDFKQIVFHAYDHARMRGQEQVRMTDLLAATVAQSVAIQELLYDLHIDAEKLTNVISWVKIREDLRMQYLSLKKAGSRRSKHGIDRAMTAVATPFLNSFSHDITLSAKYGHLAPCVAREKEIADVFRVIEGGRQSVLLVGDHGVGKMTIVEGIAQLMVEERVPKRLHDKRLVQLSTSALLAGTTVSGAIERLRNMMVEIARAGNVVLCINNLHDLVSDGKTAEKGLDVSEALSEFVGRGHGVLVIATTSVGGYNRTIAHSQLGAGFSRIDVAEMNDNQAIQVLESKVGGIEYKHKVFFSYDALATAVKLAGRFLPDERLPESAVTLIAESASAARSARGEHTLVSDQDIAGIISEKTGIPVTSLDQDERARLLHLEEEMHRRVIGQDTAVSLVANALKRARAEIRSTKRPIANFLFLGPTGVGKTELAKTIAETYFGGEQRMIRIDMSEYQGANSVYRLIGQPGQQGTGILTEAVRQQPFSLVLLDELEKADKDVLNLFLQVFDDGRLTDSVGRTIDFTNTIIIATSNAGTAYVAEQAKAGRSFEEIRQSLIRTELQTYYRPEFINRFDGVVLFQPLSREDIKHIAELMLRRVAGDLKQRGIGFRVEQEALETLADHGYDPEFGARPMRRAIQNYVENALAELILQGSVSRRDTIVLGAGCKLRVEQ